MLMVALGLGYHLGFSDAREHDRPVVSRMMDRWRDLAVEAVTRHRDVMEETARDAVKAAADEILLSDGESRDPDTKRGTTEPAPREARPTDPDGAERGEAEPEGD